MKNKLILFDFDGVVADSFTPAFETVKTICPLISELEYRKRFEGNINETKFPEEFHSEMCRHDLDFFSLYIPRIKDEVTIFPGMKEVILALEKEYTLVIISSTLTFPIEEFLVSHDLRDHFEWVMGNDVHKNKTEKIKMVFQKYEVGENDCVFVTDTLGDMHEAGKVNVQTIGVTWGFNTAETLAKGNPSKLVYTPDELLTVIQGFFK